MHLRRIPYPPSRILHCVAAQCLLYEEPEASAFLQEQFQNLLLNLRPERQERQTRVENRLYSTGGRSAVR